MVGTLQSVVLNVVAADGPPTIQLCLSILPRRSEDTDIHVLLDLRGVPGRDETLEPVQILEGVEYRYAFLGGSETLPLLTDRPEVLAPDDETGRTGRLRPGLSTGSLPISLRQADVNLGVVALEVRSRKLNYLSDYRQMLSDIAEVATEAVMERFGTSEQAFTPATVGDPRTIYQRFAFLQSLLSNDAFLAAISRIIARPYETWEAVDEPHDPRQGLRIGSQLSRQLASPMRRIPWPERPR
jgi:hypothetical protein